MVERVVEYYDSILSDESFMNCDYSLKRLLIDSNFKDDIKGKYHSILEAEKLDGSGVISLGYSKETIKNMKKRIYLFDKLFDLNINPEIELTFDKVDIDRIEKRESDLKKAMLEHMHIW